MHVDVIKPICAGAQQEDEKSECHENARYPESCDPADVVLDIIEADGGDGGAGNQAEVPPVEEGALELALLGVVIVELVGAECLEAGLLAGLCDGHKVQREVE